MKDVAKYRRALDWAASHVPLPKKVHEAVMRRRLLGLLALKEEQETKVDLAEVARLEPVDFISTVFEVHAVDVARELVARWETQQEPPQRVMTAADERSRFEQTLATYVANERLPPEAIVDALEMSVRLANGLAAAKLETVGQLRARWARSDREAFFLGFRNFGRKSLNELAILMRQIGEDPFEGALPELPKPKEPDRRLAGIRQLRAEGLTLQQVGERMGLSKERVRQILAIGALSSGASS